MNIGLHDILKFLNPQISVQTCGVGGDDGKTIYFGDASLGPRPTQAQIDAAMP